MMKKDNWLRLSLFLVVFTAIEMEQVGRRPKAGSALSSECTLCANKCIVSGKKFQKLYSEAVRNLLDCRVKPDNDK